MPALMAVQPSRNAVAPVAQAFELLVTGMPVIPISWSTRWPTMAAACIRLPL